MNGSVGLEPLIEARSISKSYRSGLSIVHALHNVSFDVGAGEFISLLGPSGCGKTTLMMTLVGLSPMDAGEAKIKGRKVDTPYIDVGIVFQNPELLDWRTALQNVMLQIEIRRLSTKEFVGRAKQLLARVGLTDFLDKFPYELSGGMKQRVALCRALVHDPEILLMDEPFGALDALTRDQMNLDLQEIWMEKRKTAVLVTHSIDEAIFLSDRVIVMTPRPGAIAEDIRIDLPRPRRLDIRSTPEFNAYEARIRQLFMDLGVLKNG